MKTALRSIAFLLAIGLAATGCSSGGGGTTPAPQAAVHGVITGLGSVIVNGIEFDTSSAVMTAESRSCTQGSFKVGMVVDVRGTIDPSGKAGAASLVRFLDDLQGPAQNIDAAGGTFTIFGVPVRVDANTRYEGFASLSALLPGDIVEVSGLPEPGASPSLRATHLELKGASDIEELKGRVVGTPGATSLVISPVPGSSATVTVLFSGSLPAGLGSGSFIEVKVASYDPVANAVTASKIELEDDLLPDNDQETSIEGYVSGYDPVARTFMIGTTKVDASGIANLGPITNGIRAEAEGRMTNGVLVARRVDIQTASKGAITAFGSVWVNGIEYDTTNAVIMVEGRPATQGSLGVGMVVEVSGKSSDAAKTGDAVELSYHDDIQAAVDTIDRAAGTLVVMGVTVKTDLTTIFSDVAGLAGIAAGDIVEVSGYPDALGALSASRIEKKPAGEQVEIKGTVSNLDSTAMALSLTAPDRKTVYTVDYSAMGGLAPAGLANGSFVEVRSAGFTPPAGIAAASVHIEDTLEPSDGEHAEIEGVVSSLDTIAGTFLVGDTPVNAADLSLPAGLANGSGVEVSGFIVNGTLVATAVEAEQESSIEVEGDMTAIDTAGATVTLLGRTVQVNPATLYFDRSAGGDAALSLSGLAVGDHLEAAGYLHTDGVTIIATRIERQIPPSPAQASISAPISAFSDTQYTVTILGSTVATDLSTTYSDAAENPLDRATFFLSLVGGTTRVQAEWEPYTSLALPAQRLKIKGI